MKTLKSLLIALLLLPLMGWAQGPGAAQIQAKLITGVTSVQPGKAVRIGLQLTAPKDWHSYWRNPEDAGFPTSIKWKLPEGWSAGEIEWPLPQDYELFGVAMYGYGDETILFVSVQVPDHAPEGEVTLEGKVKWLECDDSTCVPGSATLSLPLLVKNTTSEPSADAGRMAAAEKLLPVPATGWSFAYTRKGNHLRVTATPPAGVEGDVQTARFYPYEKGIVTPGVDQQWAWGSPATFQLSLQPNADAMPMPEVLEGILVSDSGWPGIPPDRRAIEVSLRPEGSTLATTGLPTAAAPVSSSGLLAAILGGLLGGLILNLMPCVFPVISLKVMGFVESAHGSPGKAFRHALVFTAGVLVMFWGLAGILLWLKSLGEQLGWGFQLQNPKVVIGITVLFTLLALNLFGVFEIGTALTGVGSGLTRKGGWGGSFFSGVLAVIVATPCSAPFLGSAGGYALTQAGVFESMVIFTAVAIGMALPYIILTSSPSLMKFIPRPGDWMVTFKQIMGFLMLATAIYLLWIYGKMRGVDGLIRLVTGLLIISTGAWMYGRLAAPHQPRLKRRIYTLLALLAAIGGTLYGSSLPKDHGWKQWSPELAASLRAKGEPFLIDFTAAWCASCQVNKKIALHTESVEQALANAGVAKLVADWTDEDPRITQALAEYHRASVPLYLLFGRDPSAPPQILPEVLTPGIVLDALKKL